MRKFFKPITVGVASALIALTSFLSYAIGLIRDRVIAVNFGTTSATDTYNASFLIPDMLFNLFIAGALAAAFLPVFSEYLVKNKDEARRIANTMLTGGTLLIAVLATIAFIFMPHIIPFIFTEVAPELQDDIVNMTRLMLPSAILFAISNTLGNVLMSYKHFMAYAISPILYNAGIIVGILIFKDTFGIYAAATGVLVGASLHCIIRIVDTLTTEYRYKPRLELRHPGFKKIVKLMIPKSIALIVWQINLYIFAVMGMKLLEGSLAAFNFARNIQSFAISLFGIAFATAVFPYLTEAVSRNDNKEYVHHIQKTIQRILFFTIPSMIGIILLASPIVELILGGGLFDAKSVEITSILLLFFAISIPFEALVHILSRAFYAFQNTMTPAIIIVFSNILIAISTIYLAPRYGIYWFSLGYSIVLAIQVGLLVIFLRSKLRGFNMKEFILSLSKTVLATGLMAIAIILASGFDHILPAKLFGVAQILFGGAIFMSVAYTIRAEEINSIRYIIGRLFKKNT